LSHLIRTFNWEPTPLGPIERWPQNIRSYVEVMLNCGFPATLQWGRELTLLYNDAYAPIIGTRHPIALGQPLLETFPEIREAYEPIRQRVWKGETVVLEDMLFRYVRHHQPEDTWFTLSYSPVRENGGVSGILAIGVETTARREAERQREDLRIELERSNEELSRFSHALSHDLQAPARTVRTLAELFARNGEQSMNENQKSLLRLMVQSADGMQRLVTSMLEFAQVGNGEIRREAVPISELVNAVLVKLAASVRESHAKVICGPLPQVECDPVQIEQVLQNLIANAIHYRRLGHAPVIQISGESIDSGWSFAIQDNGEGIPLESQHSIFEPLKRLHGSELPGSGLGLALCRKIVERHGGHIWVESDGEGTGSTFRFTLKRP